MRIYNYYNEEYGIRVLLTLDKDKEELTYQCLDIKDKYLDNFKYECKNGWKIESFSGMDISYLWKILFLRGGNVKEDNNIITMSDDGYCVGVICYTLEKTYEDIEQIYNGLTEALDELGNNNDFSEAKLFLNM